MIIVLLLLAITITWSGIRFRQLTGVVGQSAVIAISLLVTGLLWRVVLRLEWLNARRDWCRRPLPAIRLSPAGLDYSAAFTGDFPVHVDWAMAEGCRYRRGPGGDPFWCVDASVIEGLGPLPPRLQRRSLVRPALARAVAVRQARIAAALGGQTEDVDLLTLLLAFGTPIAINLSLVEGASIRDVDLRIREWTQDRCSLRSRFPSGGRRR
jgi:hypothetical protein